MEAIRPSANNTALFGAADKRWDQRSRRQDLARTSPRLVLKVVGKSSRSCLCLSVRRLACSPTVHGQPHEGAFESKLC